MQVFQNVPLLLRFNLYLVGYDRLVRISIENFSTPDHAPKRQASEDRKLQRQGSSSKLTSGRYQQPKIQRQNSGSQLRPSNLQRQNSGSQLRPSHLGGSSSKTTPLQRQNSNSQLRVTASGVGVVFGFT